MPDEITPAQISEENKPENLVGQATPEFLPESPKIEENPIPVSPDEPTIETPIPSSPSNSVKTSLDKPEASPSPSPSVQDFGGTKEEVVLDKDQNQGNEPFDEAQDKPLEQVNPNPPATASPEASRAGITIEKHGNDVTITEVMPVRQAQGEEPTAQPKTQTAQTERFEPFAKGNPAKQARMRSRIDKILTMFSKDSNVTNDEVEKLLHVSDATATRYLEVLEKEGKIKQVGKTGKGVTYQKI